jgi:NadR type nicotinamide-nucleotide adenylyltransferase
MSSAVKRVCLLGAESTGKSTLARALADRFGTVWNPEYGRPYTLIGRPEDAPWTSWEFTHIARIHCWYEDFLAESASRVLFSDTDAFTTALFHEVYLGEPAVGFEELVARPYDLRVVCGLEVPWRHDGIREFEKQRRWMHERYVEHARSSGSPWLVAEGPLDERLRVVADAVDAVLA